MGEAAVDICNLPPVFLRFLFRWSMSVEIPADTEPAAESYGDVLLYVAAVAPSYDKSVCEAAEASLFIYVSIIRKESSLSAACLRANE